MGHIESLNNEDKYREMHIVQHKFSWENDESQKIFSEFVVPSIKKGRAIDQVGKIMSLSSLSPSSSVLDVGCGFGLHLAEFGRCGFSVTGIEISDYAVEKAKEACAGIQSCTVLKMRGSEIPWINEFDLVLALDHTLGFIEPKELYLHFQKMCKAVKHQGIFLLGIPGTLEAMRSKFPVNKWEMRDEKYVLEEKYISKDNIKKEHCIIIDPLVDRIDEWLEEQRYYSLKEILGILKGSGIENVQIMRDLDGNPADEAKEAFFFMARK